MSILSDDLAAIFADTALTVPVVFGTQETTGFLSSEDVLEADGYGGSVLVNRSVVTIRTDSLDDLASNAAITVDDVDYVIHGRPRSAGRGKTKLILAEAS